MNGSSPHRSFFSSNELPKKRNMDIGRQAERWRGYEKKKQETRERSEENESFGVETLGLSKNEEMSDGVAG